MTERLTYAAIEETVSKAKDQACSMIERNLRNAIYDFENSNSTGFKLTLTIEGERKGRDAMLTLQTKAQSAVDLKRKDQTQAEVVDWGPQLFDPDNVETIPADDDEDDEEPRRLLPAAPKLLPAPAEAEDDAAVAEDGETEDDQTEDNENGDENPND